MQRVLILSYFFPPCNLTAAQRAYSWARYLNELGYFPVIITRRWDVEIEKLQSLSEATSQQLLHEIHPGYEVIYLPYKPNLRDRIYSRHGDKKYRLLRKLLSLWEIIAQLITNRFIPFRNIYDFAVNYLKEHPGTSAILVTGNPFILFKFGYRLHRKFGLPWIADYRDAWTTSNINKINRSAASEMINRLERHYEKKWCRTTAAVTSVSQPVLTEIIQLLRINHSAVIENGYFSDEIPNAVYTNSHGPFTITYVGTVFPGQHLGFFASAFHRFVEDKNPDEVRLQFLGAGYVESQLARIQSVYCGLEPFLQVTSRIPRRDVLQREMESHVLLHFAWKDFSGIIGSKLYEYIGLGKPILICPTDNDIVDRMLAPYNMACLCADSETAVHQLNRLFELHKKGRYHEQIPDADFQKRYTRYGQTQKLASLIDQVTNSHGKTS